MAELTPKLYDEWIQALRSDKYHQHEESLTNKDGDAFCCLGVLCDLTLPPDTWHGLDMPEPYFFLPLFRSPNDIFPLARAAFKNLPLTHSRVTTIADLLATINDDTPANFKDIADFLDLPEVRHQLLRPDSEDD